MTQAFNLALLANKVNSSGQLDASTGLYNAPIPSGSVFLLYQASAPTGWTQVTSLNDYALRIVSSTGGTTGGTTAFSTVFTNQTLTIVTSGLSADATTLSTAQIPSHNHSIMAYYLPTPVNNNNGLQGGVDSSSTLVNTSGLTGGGGSHTHTISGTATSSAVVLNVRYANIIICSKN